jgi:hypothetical protein
MNLTRFIAVASLAATVATTKAQILVPQLVPYTNDANTVLLEHFDGATSGTPNGTVFYTNGVFGQGVHLSPTSLVSWSLGALSQGTVEFWGQVETMTNVGVGFVYSSVQANNWSTFFTGLDATNNTKSEYVDANDNWQGMTTPSIFTNSVQITTNTWHHYATTWGSKGFHFYVDGTLIYSNTATGGQYSTTYWSVSANKALGNQGPGFNGTIDEFRISNVQRVFAPAQSQVKFVKAFTIDFQNLLIGSNYVLQASSNLVDWTNWAEPFTATNSAYTNSNYQRIDNWSGLFFRLKSE